MNTDFLVIGATGLIGKAVIKALGKEFKWVGTTHPRSDRNLLHLDITDQKEVEEVFGKAHPKYVIFCANLKGGMDFCQNHPDLAEDFHFKGIANIGSFCKRYNSKFIFISSECVFDGKKEIYNEGDRVNPISVYGKYKVKAEEWIQDNLEDYIIARTMAVYGWDPKTLTPNAVMKVYISILKEERISVPNFRWGNPTYVGDLAKALVALALSKDRGVFHLAGASFVSRYQWLKKACEILGWDKSYLIAQEEPLGNDKLRPLRIGLSTKKFEGSFNDSLHNLEEGLSLLKEDIERNE